MRYLVVIVAILLLAGSVAAESLLQRTDVTPSGDPSYTFGITLDSGLELWAMGLPNWPDLEIGKTWLMPGLSDENRQVYLSAYLIDWPKADDQLFICPWPSACWKVGKAEVKADLYAYIPLNGGPLCIGTFDTGVTWPVEKGRVGLSFSDWKQEKCDHSWGLGVIASYPVGKGLKVTARYVPEWAGSTEAARLQFNYDF